MQERKNDGKLSLLLHLSPDVRRRAEERVPFFLPPPMNTKMQIPAVRSLLPLGWLSLFFVCGWLPVKAGEVILKDQDKIQDTYLRGDNEVPFAPGVNFGASQRLLVGRLPDDAAKHLANTLMRFELSDLAGQTVTHAVLRLHNVNDPKQTADVTINIHELAAANGDWVEGDGIGGESGLLNGTSDWRFKLHGRTVWAGGQNGAGVKGEDYMDAVIGSAMVSAGTAQSVEFELDTNVIQKWIDHPEQNGGIILIAPEAEEGAMAYFYSTEAENRFPRLILETSAR